MARNPVQFQKGMSEAEFDRLFPTEERCWVHLVQWRWPKGFACPICGGNKYSLIFVGKRRLFQCSQCRTQTSVTAGTIFASTKLPLK
ncbi:transposase, partial [Megalodesulfovibrio gigas]